MMLTPKETVRSCFTVPILPLLSACNGYANDLVPVSGVVTLDDKPIAGTMVSFQPIAGDGATPGPGSVGRCDESGRYVLNTIRDEPGAVVGTHRVRIYSYSPESPIAQDTDTGRPQEQFPDRYNYGSELTFDVESGGTESADFLLTN